MKKIQTKSKTRVNTFYACEKMADSDKQDGQRRPRENYVTSYAICPRRFCHNCTGDPAPNEFNLVWVDMEMTGLEPDTDRIIEVAVLSPTCT
jgi:hypothetical protein